jgi:CBS domain-containing protein
MEDRMRVRELMSSPVHTIGPETSLKEAARLLEAHGVSALPVVAEGRLLGIVSRSDLVRAEQLFELDDRRTGESAELAGEALTAPPITVEPETSAVGAAWLMTRNDVDRLPVVERGALVGIVTRSDLVRALGRPDVGIRREIVEEILPSLDVSPNDVLVTVSDGAVALHGSVEDDVTARCLVHAVRGVIGVAHVESELRSERRERRIDTVSARL